MKKIPIIILTILFLFIGVDRVEAIYNGAAGPTTPTGGTCKNNWAYCTWDNDNFTAVQLRLVYYDSNTQTREYLGNPYYIVNKDLHYNNLVAITGDANRVLQTNDINVCSNNKNQGPVGDKCIYNSYWLNERYSDESSNKTQAEANLKDLIQKMGVDIHSLTKRNDDGIGYYNSGYRILVEPVMYFKHYGTGIYATVKEAHADGGTSNPKEHGQESTLLYTKHEDIGISKIGTYENQSTVSSEIGDPTTGWGYNIIDPVRSALKKCYKLTVKGQNPVCINTNKQNRGRYYETFVEAPCDSGDIVDNANEYGALTKTINEDCKIYCTERVDVAYPGHISPQIAVGTYFEWPTFGAGQKHNLNITGRKTCKVEGNSCPYSVDKNALYPTFRSKVSLTFEQPNDYKKDTFTLKQASEDFTCDGCEGLWNGKNITVTRQVSLKLPENKYRYIDKKTSIAYDSPSKGASKYTNIGYGTLPTSKNSVITWNGQPKQYNLRLSNFELGENTQFDTISINANYTCKYSLTTGSGNIIPPAVGYKCPPGTKFAGKDLYDIIYNANKKGENMTYADAIEKHCDDDDDDPPPPPGQRYCPYPNQHISIEECVVSGQNPDYCIEKNCPGPKECIIDCMKEGNDRGYCENVRCSETCLENCTKTGNTIEFCEKEVCLDCMDYCLYRKFKSEEACKKECDPTPKLPDKYQCPKNTPHAYMDITGCVESLIAKGEKEANAIKICQDIICPADSVVKGIPIIYRTISLKNPFPSKNLNGGITGFNNEVRGRYPGANWNSKALVQAEILENRGVKDNEVYKKEPLYKFTLDSKTISTIRTYNKSQIKAGGYSDFTLECRGSDGSKCISTFLRETIKIQSGTCKSSSVNTFDSCAD